MLLLKKLGEGKNLDEKTFDKFTQLCDEIKKEILNNLDEICADRFYTYRVETQLKQDKELSKQLQKANTPLPSISYLKMSWKRWAKAAQNVS